VIQGNDQHRPRKRTAELSGNRVQTCSELRFQGFIAANVGIFSDQPIVIPPFSANNPDSRLIDLTPS
jgi:hypothetical protein